MASLAFLTAIFSPRICESMRVEMASPAASSEAELILDPVDNLCIAVDKLRLLILKASCEINDLMLVLMTDIVIPFSELLLSALKRAVTKNRFFKIKLEHIFKVFYPSAVL